MKKEINKFLYFYRFLATDNYYKYKLSADDELLPILTDNIPALDRQISQQIQNAITKGELHQAKNKSKSYSYER